LDMNDDTMEIPDNVIEMSKKRWQYKKEWNYLEADNLRNQILELWFEVKDDKGTYLILKK
jgi:cysteinyl-tRNA synthetase